jgi:hypothetical protein
LVWKNSIAEEERTVANVAGIMIGAGALACLIGEIKSKKAVTPGNCAPLEETTSERR